METDYQAADLWDIKTNIGPIALNIMLDASFFANDQQHNERHQHSTCEFQIITGGSGLVQIGDVQHEIAAGSYCII
ncbi:MAG TPA: hypothetical protein DD640_05255, partial [Clostridiales bacterium]|nr:hypothetical protein [Clostridiales bacterium]